MVRRSSRVMPGGRRRSGWRCAGPDLTTGPWPHCAPRFITTSGRARSYGRAWWLSHEPIVVRPTGRAGRKGVCGGSCLAGRCRRPVCGGCDLCCLSAALRWWARGPWPYRPPACRRRSCASGATWALLTGATPMASAGSPHQRPPQSRCCSAPGTPLAIVETRRSRRGPSRKHPATTGQTIYAQAARP